jgi:hypothetical protein
MKGNLWSHGQPNMELSNLPCRSSHRNFQRQSQRHSHPEISLNQPNAESTAARGVQQFSIARFLPATIVRHATRPWQTARVSRAQNTMQRAKA